MQASIMADPSRWSMARRRMELSYKAYVTLPIALLCYIQHGAKATLRHEMADYDGMDRYRGQVDCSPQSWSSKATMARFLRLDSIQPVNSLPLAPWTVAYVCLLVEALIDVELTFSSSLANIWRM